MGNTLGQDCGKIMIASLARSREPCPALAMAPPPIGAAPILGVLVFKVWRNFSRRYRAVPPEAGHPSPAQRLRLPSRATLYKYPRRASDLAPGPALGYILPMTELAPLSFEFPDSLKKAGRQGVDFALEFNIVRELDDKDMLEIFTISPESKARPIKRITQTHHAIARLMAAGLSQVDIARMVGYSAGRISVLKADPAFNELVVHYSNVKEMAFVDVHEQIANTSSDALGVLQERLEEEPENFATAELIALAKMTLDRSGHGPTKTTKIVDAAAIVRELKEKVQSKGQILEREISV